MTDKSSADDSRALLKFCRSLFETGNLIGTDFKASRQNNLIIMLSLGA